MSDDQKRWLRKATEAGLDKKEIEKFMAYMEGQTVDKTCEALKAWVLDPEFDSEDEYSDESDGESEAESDGENSD